MGSFELQIFVSLFVILGAAFVALLCDFLKGNNERLREKNIELSVRHEERDKREDLLDRAQRQAWNTAVQAQEAWLYQSMRGAVAELQTEAQQVGTQTADAPTPDEDSTAGEAPQITFSIGVKPLEGPLSLPPPEMLAIDAQPQPLADPPAPAMPRMAAPSLEGLRLALGGPCYPSPEPPYTGSESHHETSASIPLTFPASSSLTPPLMEAPGTVTVGVPVQPHPAGYRWSEAAGSFAWAAWRLLPGFVRSWLERTPPEAPQCPLAQEVLIGPPGLSVPPFALIEFGLCTVSAMPGTYRETAERSPARPSMVPLLAEVVDWPAGIRCWDVRPEALPPAILLPAFPPFGEEAAQLGQPAQLLPIEAELAPSAGRGLDSKQPGCALREALEHTTRLPLRRGLKTESGWAVASVDPPVAGHSEVARAALLRWKPESITAGPLASVWAARLPAMTDVSLHPLCLVPGEELLPLETPALCALPGLLLSPDFGPSQQALPAHSAAPLLSIAAETDAAFSADCETAPGLAGTSPVSLPGLHRQPPRTHAASIAFAVRLHAGCVPTLDCALGSPELSFAGQVEWAAAGTPLAAAAGRCVQTVPVPIVIGGYAGVGPRFAPLVPRAGGALPVAGPVAVPLPQARAFLPGDPLPDGEPARFTLASVCVPSAKLTLELEPFRIPVVEVPVPIERGLVRSSYHLFAALPPALDRASASLPPARFDLSAPDSLPEAPPEPVVRIRVLREDDVFAHLAAAGPDPLASSDVAAGAPSTLESFSSRAGFLSAAPAAPNDTPSVVGGFAPESPLPLKSSAQSPGIVTMPNFGELKTLFFPSALNIERKPDRPGVLVKMPCANSLSCSPGVHPPAVLQQLLSRPELFSGMAMVLAVVDYQKVAHQHPASAIEPILEEAFDAMRAGAGKNAFLCRCADGEFVILWPRDLETNPQKALHEVTERLWDFQLRTLGAVPLIFGWGNLEASGEALAGVLTAARDRMTESARNRRSAGSGVGRFRRHAVS